MKNFKQFKEIIAALQQRRGKTNCEEMELLKEIKPVKLQKYFVPAEHRIITPSKQPSQSIHFIEGTTKRLRHQSIIGIVLQYLTSHPGIALLFDLDYTWTPKTQDYHTLREKSGQSFNRVAIEHVKDMESLIKSLKSIQTFQFKHLVNESLPLGLLIVDNISSFHWQMVESLDFPMEYNALNSILCSIKRQFNCGIVSTSLDSQFETGIISRKNTQDWSNLTKLPRELVVDTPVYYITYSDGAVQVSLVS